MYSPHMDICRLPSWFRWAAYLEDFREFPSMIKMLFTRKEEFDVFQIPGHLQKVLNKEFKELFPERKSK